LIGMAETQRLTDLERASLVAYLDGELNEVEVRALGNKITQSVTARREIDALQKTWDLLDYLPKPDLAPDFANRTMTLALEDGQKGAKVAAIAGHWGTIGGRISALIGVAALTLMFGYVATRWIWPDPSARLARDLPIAEYLDEYREIGSYEFLKLLEQSPVLNEDAE
jgi:hypothetical protein